MKVAFGKKERFSLTHGLWRMHMTITKKIQNSKSVSAFIRPKWLLSKAKLSGILHYYMNISNLQSF